MKEGWNHLINYDIGRFGSYCGNEKLEKFNKQLESNHKRLFVIRLLINSKGVKLPITDFPVGVSSCYSTSKEVVHIINTSKDNFIQLYEGNRDLYLNYEFESGFSIDVEKLKSDNKFDEFISILRNELDSLYCCQVRRASLMNNEN
jgi:hypothetical protein